MNTVPWVTAEQVAQHLGVLKDTVYRWRERKGLPAHKIGRLRKFRAFQNCDALRQELSWTHYRLLLRMDDARTRQWYMNEAATQKRSSRALNRRMRMYDDLKRSQDDNPTVGTLLCEHKDQSVVQYSVLHESAQLFASNCRLLPSEEELRRETERERASVEEATSLAARDLREEGQK